jgi:transcription elongation factor GreB
MARARDRTRPDESDRPGYITPEGHRRLEEEAKTLWNVKRPEVAKALANAAAEGDRSENAEYIYRKKQLGQIDRRLRFLAKRLDVLTVITDKPKADGRVYFGCTVTLEDEDGEVKKYRIVGPDEWNLEQGEISVDSPVARALIGRHVGDEVMLKRPKEETSVVITDISVS